MRRPICAEEVEVRDLRIEDLDGYIDYWHNPENTALDALGIDRSKMYSAKKMREMLGLTIANNGKLERSRLAILAIVYRGRTIGVHELTELSTGDSAVMHAHIWKEECRGLGIGAISYVKAMELYFERFSLKTIRFQTPRSNKGATRIKEKLGLEKQGSQVYNLPILRRPVETDTYVVRKEHLARVVERVRRWQSE